MKNYGYQNEKDFVALFNNKYFYELDDRSQSFIMELFNNEINNGEKIITWKNSVNQKADILIKYGKFVKRVSLKSGNSNSIHCEQIQTFKCYLERLNIPYKIIEKYVSYHYGYKRDSNGHFDYSCQLSSYDYKEIYQDEIDLFNASINKTRIMIDMIDRFLIRGNNSDYDIDALISGTVDDYVWILKYDLYDLILSKKNMYFTSPHISCLTIGPKKRCLNNNKSNIKDRYLVAIRWHNLKDDILEFRKLCRFPSSNKKTN
ncbi:MAG: hypothetical protein IKG27_06655 [Bacilli bacterium]|nr:hypothetical protein [Bacilli bacterium]